MSFYTLNKIALCASFISATSICTAADTNRLEETVITADFYQTNALTLPASLTVIDNTRIQTRGAEHLEDLLGLAPNVNFATGASRGRFIQIRGIGERSEFIEPVNHSVGVLVDGIDFTGISTAASTLDIQQVEILRGPQGTVYGAKALAGLINMVSAAPTEQTTANFEGSVGNYNSRTLKGAVGGALTDAVGYRVAGQTSKSDGFYTNSYLDRDNTNHIDETSLRGKLAIAASANLSINLTAFYADVDNGYDVFNFENTRQTQSNNPGHDRQQTKALALAADWQINDSLNLETHLSRADSDIEYSYDEDWRNPDFCMQTTCTFGADGYHSAFDQYRRQNDNNSLDIRLVSNSNEQTRQWVLGFYYRDQHIELKRSYIDGYGSPDDLFSSRYATTNTAIYGNWSQAVTGAWTLSLGGRIERRDADYSDDTEFGFSTDETLWGGKLSLNYQIAADKMAYLSLSRGYKPGGANSNSDIPATEREYDTETMRNYELGLKGRFFDARLESQLAIFYQDRSAIQTDSAIVDCSSLPCTFDDYLTNAAKGDNYGIEAQLNYMVTDLLSLYGSFGLLSADYGNYTNYQHVNADEDSGVGVAMAGRDQPQAPAYQFIAGINSQITESLNLDMNLEGKDRFYLSNDSDIQANSYVLLNANLSYQAGNWSASVWGKNLTDKQTLTRGFGTFGNDPSNGYTTEGYYQLGAPRTIGITGRYSF